MSYGFTPPNRYMETGPCIGRGTWHPSPITEYLLGKLMFDSEVWKNSKGNRTEMAKETESESTGQNILKSASNKKDEQAMKALNKLNISGKKENGYKGDDETESIESVVKVHAPRGELVFNGVCYDDHVTARFVNHIEVIEALDNFDSSSSEFDDQFFIGPLRMHHDRISCKFTAEETNELVEDLSDFVDERLDEFYKGDELDGIRKVNRFTLNLMKSLLITHQNAVVISELFYLLRCIDGMGEEEYNELEMMFLQTIACIME